jgi:NTE family protein
MSERLALAMGGGGARAAYQVGVLRSLARRYPQLDVRIHTGVSAGAINSAFLANGEDSFQQTVEQLGALWSSITSDQVFDSNAWAMLGSVLRWGTRLVSGGSKLAPPTRGLVDTGPLRELLMQGMRCTDGRLEGIARNIARGRIDAVGLPTTDYATGRTIVYVQGPEVEPWTRPNRISVKDELTVDHVMASAALPLFFPAVKIGERWLGDGGIRLTSPLAPALHMGADRIVAVSTRYGKTRAEEAVPETPGYPPPAQVMGVMMNAVFLDALDWDALNMARINSLLRNLPPEHHAGLRVVELLILRPSRDLGKLASEFEPRLPQPFRFMTRGLGTRETRSPDSLALVMFEPAYLQALMELGEQDGEAHAPELDAFLAGEYRPAVQRTSFWRI